MATLNFNTTPAGRASGPIFRVSTREISHDFLHVGTAQPAQELGALTEPAFRELLARFAALPATKLLDGDPLLIVAAKRGRFHVTPSGGALLLRPAADSQQTAQRFSVDDLPGYLDSTDYDVPAKSLLTAPPITPSTLIGALPPAAEPLPPPKPSGPPAPIYGEIPVARSAASTTVAPPKPAAPKPPLNRPLLIGAALALVLTAAVSAWIFFSPPSPPPRAPARPPSEFDLVTSAQLSALQKRFIGIYATTGESGERLLELRADGTYRYQEFGTGVARTVNRTGTYTFAFHRDTDSLVIRASVLGTIEAPDEKHLLCQRAVFTRLP